MTFWLAPRARFRIYTRASDYPRVFRELVTDDSREEDLARLEQAVAARVGAAHGICMPQARVGIYFAIKNLIRPGQKVILSPYTIADVINMVICAGGVPVFADIDRPSTNISADRIEELLDDSTGAVMVTHLHGIPCEIERIAATCKARKVPLVEDTAQAFGARVSGRRLGTFGEAGIFSFGMYKNVTGFYGGMVVTNADALARKIRADMAGLPYMPMGTVLAKVRKAAFTDFSTWPLLFRSSVYWIFRYGYLKDIGVINKMVTIELDTSRKSGIPQSYLNRMRPFQARMVLRQLDDLDRYSAVRIQYSKIYHEGFRDIPDLVIPPFKDDGSHIYNYFPIQYRDRKALVQWAMLHRRDLAVQHLKNTAALPSFAPEQRACPNAALTAEQTILLPNYPSYGEDEVRKNVEVIRAFFTTGPGRA